MIPTKDQSECFDPYINVFLGFNDITGLLTLGICGSGLIFSILNFIILFKLRDTPFVKAFDVPKLVQHLLFMTFSFGFLSLFVYWETIGTEMLFTTCINTDLLHMSINHHLIEVTKCPFTLQIQTETF